MRAGGQAEIDKAKADGRWERAYAGSGEMEVSEELQSALDADLAAKAVFETLSKSQRWPFLVRLQTAKKAETKTRLIAQYVAMLTDEEET